MSETDNSESAATPEHSDSQKNTDFILKALDTLEITGQKGNRGPKAIKDSNSSKETDTGSKENLDSLDVDDQKKNKVDVLFKATGNAPIMKRRRWLVENEKTVANIIVFLKTKLLHLGSNESLFIYVNQSFAPSPDQNMKNLYECFGTNGKLILHYCKTQAWG